jgi:hypothetical protein
MRLVDMGHDLIALDQVTIGDRRETLAVSGPA